MYCPQSIQQYGCKLLQWHKQCQISSFMQSPILYSFLKSLQQNRAHFKLAKVFEKKNWNSFSLEMSSNNPKEGISIFFFKNFCPIQIGPNFAVVIFKWSSPPFKNDTFEREKHCVTIDVHSHVCIIIPSMFGRTNHVPIDLFLPQIRS